MYLQAAIVLIWRHFRGQCGIARRLAGNAKKDHFAVFNHKLDNNRGPLYPANRPTSGGRARAPTEQINNGSEGP